MKLCYIENNVLYFTSDIDNQWGDDWDDIPYEHNASPPYETSTTVKKIAFIGDYSEPCSLFKNSPYSVADINNGIIHWAYTAKAGGLYGGDSMGKAIKWLKDNNFEWAVLHESTTYT